MIQVSQAIPYRGVAPEWVPPGHLQDQFGNDHHDARATRALSTVGPMPGDQATMPAQDRVGRHNIGDLEENPSTQRLAQSGKSSALVVVETRPPALQLFLLRIRFSSIR